jgi:hypothetical protein
LGCCQKLAIHPLPLARARRGRRPTLLVDRTCPAFILRAPHLDPRGDGG